MSERIFPVTAMISTLDGEGDAGERLAPRVLLGEVLFFPEATVLAGRRPRLHLKLSKHVKEVIARTPLGAVYRRRRSGEPAVQELAVTIDPPRGGPGATDDADGARADAPPAEAWQRPVAMRFHVVRWRHGERAVIAYVPALGVEVIATDDAELDERLPSHVRAALLRRGVGRSLRGLAELQRVTKLALHPIEVGVTIKSPKRAAIDADREPQERPVIEQVGADLTRQSLPRAWELEGPVAALADALTGRNPWSVLLVGKPGVGKTSVVYELVRRRAEFQLGQTPFWATSGARLVAGMSGFGMWQERCQRLCREASTARAVVYLGNLIELTEVGRSTHNAQGIASFLRPYVARGEVLAIAECTPEQLAILERQDPHTLEAFAQIAVDEPTPEVTRTILLHELLAAAGPRGALPMDDAALDAVDALHRRYATYSAFPARPVRFVRNLLRDRAAAAAASAAESTQTTTRRNVMAAFARETGLPLMLLDESVPLDLEAARQWFASRVIGQAEAVDLVCDLIATVKAAMGRPRRPIASLLFIGPTGVGKTEMAKALAEFFFGDATRLARFDMSEYATPAAVERLVGGGYGGAEGLLTARVREQPFSVVLLDEFEKAHPALFDLMLQVLGEGRLTDAAGRVADFGNAVVVMTSNLGAQSFQQTPFGLGRPRDGAVEAGEAKRHFVEAVREHFRPEMFNRIDRVVPFAPLGAEVILNITRRELDLVRRRDGAALRGATLEVSEEAVRHLAERGFDARYGARPLKRAIERELLVPLADGINGYAEDAKLEARATVEAGTLAVTVRIAGGDRSPGAGADLAATAGRWTALRRKLQALGHSPAVTGMQNELFALQRLKERLELMRRARERVEREGRVTRKRPAVRVEDDARLVRLPRLLEVAEALRSLTEHVTDGETDALLAAAGDAPPPPGAAGRFVELTEEWRRVLLAIFALRFAKANESTLVFFGQSTWTVYDLARAYYDFAESRGGRVQIWWFERAPTPAAKKPIKPQYTRVVLQSDLLKPAAFFEQRRPVAAVALMIHMPNAQVLFAGQGGTQVFRNDGKPTGVVRVDAVTAKWSEYELPMGADRPDQLSPKQPRRTYDLDKNVAYDAVLGAEFRWPGRQWSQVIEEAVELQVQRATDALLGEGAAGAGA